MRGISQENVAYQAEIAVHTYRRLETGLGGSSLDSLLRTMIALDMESLSIEQKDVCAGAVGSTSADEVATCERCLSAPPRTDRPR
jgi:hypothetical protein